MGKKERRIKEVKRAFRRTVDFAKKTRDRAEDAWKEVDTNKYNLSRLIDDVFGQWADMMSAFFPAPAAEEVSTAYFTTGPGVGGKTPPSSVVSLTDLVVRKDIKMSDLVDSKGNVYPATDYELLNPDDHKAIPQAAEVETVEVNVKNVPKVPGMYQGVLTVGDAKVVARIVYVLTS